MHLTISSGATRPRERRNTAKIIRRFILKRFKILSAKNNMGNSLNAEMQLESPITA